MDWVSEFLAWVSLSLLTGLFVASWVGLIRCRIELFSLFMFFIFLRWVARPSFLLAGWDDLKVAGKFDSDLGLMITWSTIMVMFGLVFAIIGYVKGNRLSRSLAARLPAFTRKIQLGRLLVVNYMLFLGGLILFLNIARHYENLGALGIAFHTGQVAKDQIFNILFYGIPGVAALGVVLSVAQRRKGFAIAFGSLLLVSSSMVLMTGDRSSAVIPFLAAILLWGMAIRRISLKSLVVVVAMVLFGMSSLPGIKAKIAHPDRVSMRRLEIEPFRERFALSLTSALNLETYDYFLLLLQERKSLGIQYGKHFYLGIIGIIPRIWWPGKPETISAGKWFSDKLFPEVDAGKPITSLGVWYINFWYPGILIGMFANGVLFRLLREWHNRRRNAWVTFLIIWLYLNVFLEGITYAWLTSMVTALGVPMLVYFSATGRKIKSPILAKHNLHYS
jgi:oligosaccharide repeat unit polymerase